MFKSKTRALGISGCGNYWEISDEVLNRIEAGSYLENKMRHNEYLKDNPLAARKKVYKPSLIFTNFKFVCF